MQNLRQPHKLLFVSPESVVFGNEGNESLDISVGGVYAEVVSASVAPRDLGDKTVVSLAVGVDLFDLSYHLSVGQMIVVSALHLTSCHL